jgi:hypothetical protein
MKAEGNIQVKEAATFGKAKWKQRFCKIEDEKMHIFADKGAVPKTSSLVAEPKSQKFSVLAVVPFFVLFLWSPHLGFATRLSDLFLFFVCLGDTKAKTTFDVMKVNDLCKSPSLDPQVRLPLNQALSAHLSGKHAGSRP